MGATKIPVIEQPINEKPATISVVEESLSEDLLDEMGEIAVYQIREEMKQEGKIAAEKGEDLLKKKQYLPAALQFGKAIQNVGMESGVLYFFKRATCLVQLEKLLSARRDCDKVISLKPDFVKAYKLRGDIYMKQKKFVEAKKDFEKVMKLNSNEDVYVEIRECDKFIEQQNGKKVTNTTPTTPAKMETKNVNNNMKQENWLTPQLLQSVTKNPEMIKIFSNPRLVNAITEVL